MKGDAEKTKSYLRQAYLLDKQIDSKIQEMAQMNALATRVTSVYSDVPPGGTRNVHKMEDTIAKILDYEKMINREIDRLVDLRQEIHSVIDAVGNPEYRTLLDMRYLKFSTWEQIAVELGYHIRYIHKIHNRALLECGIPESGH